MPRATMKEVVLNKIFRILEGMFGGYLKFTYFEEALAIAAAAYTDSSSTFPAGSLVLACTGRMKTAMVTAVTLDLGISGNTNKFTALGTIAAAANSTGGGFAEDLATIPSGATAVRVTPNTTPAAGAVIILQGLYAQMVAPQRTVKR